MEEYYYDKRSNSAYNDTIIDYKIPDTSITDFSKTNNYMSYNYLERSCINNA